MNGATLLRQTLALSGAGEGGFNSGEMLRLSLELAAATDADTDVGFEQLKDAAAAIVHLLEADDQGFQTWPVRLMFNTPDSTLRIRLPRPDASSSWSSSLYRGRRVHMHKHQRQASTMAAWETCLSLR